jgi:hypothetical protein
LLQSLEGILSSSFFVNLVMYWFWKNFWRPESIFTLTRLLILGVLCSNWRSIKGHSCNSQFQNFGIFVVREAEISWYSKLYGRSFIHILDEFDSESLLQLCSVNYVKVARQSWRNQIASSQVNLLQLSVWPVKLHSKTLHGFDTSRVVDKYGLLDFFFFFTCPKI